MSQTPDIQIKVGAYTDVDTAPIYKDISIIRDNINKNPPKIALSLNISKTQANITKDLKNIISNIDTKSFAKATSTSAQTAETELNKISDSFSAALRQQAAAVVSNLVTLADEAQISAKAMGLVVPKTEALSMAMNAGLSLAISGAISLFVYLIQSQERARQAAEESAKAFNDTVSSIDDYKNQISELKTELETGNLTEQEAYDKRSQLIEIQKALYDSYGAEAQGIDLVNGTLDDQLSKLDAITQEEAAADLTKNATQYRKAAKKMEQEDSYNLGLFINPSSEGGQELRDLADGLKKFGISTDSNSDGTYNIRIKANAKDAKKGIDELAAEANKINLGKEIADNLSDNMAVASNEVDKIIKNYNTLYDTRNFEKIITDDNLVTYYNQAAKALSNYNEAVKSGDQDQISSTLDAVAKAKEAFLNAVSGNTGEIDWVNSFFSVIQSELDKHAFVLKFTANQYDVEKVKEALSHLQGLDDQGILAIGDIQGTEEQERAYNDLSSVAVSCGGTIEDLIDYLVESGEVSGRAADQVDDATADVSTDLTALQKLINDTTSGSSKKIETLGTAIEQALDFRSTRLEVQKSLNEIEKLTGIHIDIDDASMVSQLQTLQQLINGDVESFYNFAQAAVSSLGIKVDNSSITGFLSQLISLTDSANGVVSSLAGTLLNLFSLAGATSKKVYQKTGNKWTLSHGVTDSFIAEHPDSFKVEWGIDTKGADLLSSKLTAKTSDSGGSGSSKPENTEDKWEEAFNTAYAQLKHEKEMDYISEQTYYSNLLALNNTYFHNRAKYIEQDRKNLEELHDLQKSINEDRLSDMENTLYLMQQNNSPASKQIAYLKQMQAEAHRQAEAYRKQGLDDNDDLIQGLIKQWWDYNGQIKDIMSDTLDDTKSRYEDAQKSIQSLIDLTVDLIKQEKNDEIDALEAQKDAQQAIIDKKKESLELTEAEISYQDQVDEYTTDISKLQAQADLLSNDTSREAQAKRATILEQITAKQKELNQYQHDDAVDKTGDALDKQLEAFQDEKDDEIDKIKSYLNNSGQLIKDAMARIDNDGITLYQNLISWNNQYGDGITSTITTAWNDATTALENYKTILNTVTTQGTMESLNDNIGSIESQQNASTHRSANVIIAEMKANSQTWHSASDAKKKDLSDKNQSLGYGELSYWIPNIYYDGKTGRWYYDSTKKVPIYHDGLSAGVVGGGATPKSDELLALLRKNEVVANQSDMSNIISKIKTGNSAIAAIDSMISKIKRNRLGSISGATNNTVTINAPANINISGSADQSVVNQLKEFSNNFSKQIAESFVLRGIKAFGQ